MGIYTDGVFPLVEQYDRETQKVEDAAACQMDEALDQSYRALVRDIEGSWQNISENKTILPQQQQILIAEELKDTLQIINPDQRAEYEQMLRDAIEKGNDLGAEYHDQVYAVLNPTEEVRTALQQTTGVPAQALRNQVEQGVNRLYRHGEDAAQRISAIVQQGLIQGWGVRRVASEVQRDGGLTKSKAITIARTETMSAFNGAAQARAIEFGSLVQWVGIGDAKICPWCASRNMKVFDPRQVKMPLHPRDRCMLVPINKDWLDPDAGIFDQEDFDFFLDYRKEGIAELNQRGKKPNTGAGPFDVGGSPKAKWVPKKFKKVAPTVKIADDGFPESIDGLKEVRSLGGSTGAKLVQDPRTGKQFVLKRGASADHLREEFAADRAYEALGVNVPKGKLYEQGGKPVKLSEYIDGTSLASLKGKARADAIKKIQQDFAADALLANWDVVGLAEDNILVDASGKVFRIDNGGSLRYRAQGKQKGKDWTKYPDELWTMREPGRNGEAFSKLGMDGIAKQINGITPAKEKDLLKTLPKDVQGTVKARLAEMRRTAGIVETLRADKWNEGYADQFTRHVTGIRKAGITEALPKSLKPSAPGSYFLEDENGKAFDDMRGNKSHMFKVREYIKSVGGDYSLMSDWQKSQGGDSWNRLPSGVKRFYTQQRSAKAGDYWWKGGVKKSNSALKSVGQQYGSDVVNSTLPAWHAFNYEMLNAVDLGPKLDRKNGTIELMRTESKGVMDRNGLSPGTTGANMKRGPLESSSLHVPTRVYGSEMTVQKVPLHRVIGTYIPERSPGSNISPFLNDRENEFLFVPEGAEFDYLSKKQTDKLFSAAPPDDDDDEGDFASLLGDDDDDIDSVIEELFGSSKKKKPKK